jgi:hypothetical protein
MENSRLKKTGMVLAAALTAGVAFSFTLRRSWLRSNCTGNGTTLDRKLGPVYESGLQKLSLLLNTKASQLQK